MLLGGVMDCCTFVYDASEAAGPMDEQLLSRHLHEAYGLLLSALVLDLDPTQECDCSLAAANDAYGILDNVRYKIADDANQATGERRAP